MLRLLVTMAALAGGALAHLAPPQITAAPKMRVVKRDDGTTIMVATSNTCGYIDGKALQAINCRGTDLRCAFIAHDSSTLVGCCDRLNDCPNTVPTTWYGEEAAHISGICSTTTCNSKEITSLFISRQIGICDGLRPYANIITAPDASATDWFCAEVQSTFQTLELSVSGGLALALSTTVISAPSTPVLSTPSTPSTPGTPSPTAPTSSESSSSKTPVAAIAGGVVGGIAILVLVAGAIWWIMKKTRRDAVQTTLQQPTALPSTGQPAAPMALYQGPSPGSPPPHLNFQNWQTVPTQTGGGYPPVGDMKSTYTSVTTPTSPGGSSYQGQKLGEGLPGSPIMQNQGWSQPASSLPTTALVEAYGDHAMPASHGPR